MAGFLLIGGLLYPGARKRLIFTVELPLIPQASKTASPLASEEHAPA